MIALREPLLEPPLRELSAGLDRPRAQLVLFARAQALRELARAVGGRELRADDAHGLVAVLRVPGVLRDLEALVERKLRGDMRVGREQVGLIAPGPEQLGERHVLLHEHLLPVVGAVLRRQEPGEHGGVRGDRGRRGRDAVVEHARLFRPLLQVRSGGLRIAVQAQVVGPDRVPDDPEDVREGAGGVRGAVGRRGREADRERGGGRERQRAEQPLSHDARA